MVSSTKPNASNPEMSVSPRSEMSRSRTSIAAVLFHFVDELLSSVQDSWPHDCEDAGRDYDDADCEHDPSDDFAALIAHDSLIGETEPDFDSDAHFLFSFSWIRSFG